MITFEIQDMTCGHCVSSVTKAVKTLDAQAELQVDLARHRVEIASARADQAALARVISDAGFTPVAVPAA